MATTVRITETYDMKTTVNKMGLVGVHTPSVSLLRKLYPGLLKNHRFVRFLKCDVVGACASVLPADPLQVGVSSGNIAPEDMFNPILYSAVTNESFDTLNARILALSDVNTLESVSQGDAITAGVDHFGVYYALLAENGKYRKAMPQAGFSIKGLVPLAHTLISPFGNVGGQGNIQVVTPEEAGGDGEAPAPNMTVPELDADWAGHEHEAIYYRGKTVKMPKFPIHMGIEDITDTPYPNVPETNVLAIVLPPARLHEFWYRMRVTWYVRFENVVSTLEAGTYTAFASVGSSAHGQNYTFAKSTTKMDINTDTVSADGVDISKIMES